MTQKGDMSQKAGEFAMYGREEEGLSDGGNTRVPQKVPESEI